ncbi:MAG: hypothetical protein HON47_02200 [Candidatus Diapherotrites archaeon]|uniref:Peptidase S74 domain-containing protein n=1 Tax=Candidatus Iainarchaeum sp. TaxID=3101447 RepID=A0A8T5GF36_9ARCH|nr:hypothetical protein [Candidatus Diapherotrites archaeon]MBT7240992.1 hypothetical protein [Candidatus Diapherotrites archaeon]
MVKTRNKNLNKVDAKKRANLKKALLGGAAIGAGVIGLSGMANADIILKSGSTTKSLSEMAASSNTLICENASGSTQRCGNNNAATGSYSTVSGGANNEATGSYSRVSGGRCNIASGNYSTINGGCGNTASGIYSTVAGGLGNTASSLYGVIGGGTLNCTQDGTIGGGYNNCNLGAYDVIGGGANNKICSGNYNSGILGGCNNIVNNNCAFIVGSNITTNANSRTFINSLNVEGLSGTVSASSGVLTTSSDERLKNICEDYCDGYCAIREIVPIKYDWKDKVLNTPGKINIGFSAQNVGAAIPESVTKNNEGYYNLDTTPILATLVNTIKEQEDEIAFLEKEIAKLEGGQKK